MKRSRVLSRSRSARNRSVRAALLAVGFALAAAVPLRASCYVNRKEECAVVRLVNHSGNPINATFVAGDQEGSLMPNEAFDAILRPTTGVNVDAYRETGIGPENARRVEWHGGFRGTLDACHIFLFYFLPGGNWSTGEVLDKPCKATEAPSGQPNNTSQQRGGQTQPPPQRNRDAAATQRKAESLDAEIGAGRKSAANAIAELDAFVASSGRPYSQAELTWRGQVYQRFVDTERRAAVSAGRQQWERQQQEEAQRRALEQRELERQRQIHELERWKARQEAAAREMRDAQEKQRQREEEARRQAAEVLAQAARAQEISRQAQRTFAETHRAAQVAAESTREREREKMVSDSVRNWKAPEGYAGDQANAVALVDPFANAAGRTVEVVPSELKFDTARGRAQTADLHLISTDSHFEPFVKDVSGVTGLEIVIVPVAGADALPNRNGSQFRVSARLKPQTSASATNGELTIGSGLNGNVAVTIPISCVVR